MINCLSKILLLMAALLHADDKAVLLDAKDSVERVMPERTHVSGDPVRKISLDGQRSINQRYLQYLSYED